MVLCACACILITNLTARGKLQYIEVRLSEVERYARKLASLLSNYHHHAVGIRERPEWSEITSTNSSLPSWTLFFVDVQINLRKSEKMATDVEHSKHSPELNFDRKPLSWISKKHIVSVSLTNDRLVYYRPHSKRNHRRWLLDIVKHYSARFLLAIAYNDTSSKLTSVSLTSK